MAQGYDKYELDNQTGQSFRFALNDILEAVATQNSGDNSPNTTNTSYPYQTWVDTTNDVVKIRDAATAGTWYSLYSVDANGQPTGAVATGSYSISTNDTGGTGGTTAIFVDTSQNVGIGTAVPSSILDIVTSAGNLEVDALGGTSTKIRHTTTGGILALEGDAGIRFDINGDNEKVRIDSSGRLGIGASSPSKRLQIGDTTVNSNNVIALGLRVTSAQTNLPLIGHTSDGTASSLGLCATSGSGAIQFFTGNGADGFGSGSCLERMRITSTGTVSVGNSSAGSAGAKISINTSDAADTPYLEAAYPGTFNYVAFYTVGTSGSNPSASSTAMKIWKSSSTSRSISAAGTINASGADYAEYMTKSGDFIVAKGDICGINLDGKLTNVFADAIGFVVKSTDPSYVGGDTWATENAVGTKPSADEPELLAQWEADFETARQKVDRIAFAGQVPINVTGATPGQYIVPVEDNGGISGIAKDEADLTLAEYMRAVGKVIAIEDDGRARIIVKVA